MIRIPDDLEDRMERAERGTDPYRHPSEPSGYELQVALRCSCSAQLTGAPHVAATVAAAFTAHEGRCTALRVRQTAIRSCAFVLCAAICALAVMTLSSGRPLW